MKGFLLLNIFSLAARLLDIVIYFRCPVFTGVILAVIYLLVLCISVTVALVLATRLCSVEKLWMLPELTCVELHDIILIAIKGIHLVVIGDFAHIFFQSCCVHFIFATPRFVAHLTRTFWQVLGTCVWGQKTPGLPLLVKSTLYFICLELDQYYIYTCIFFVFLRLCFYNALLSFYLLAYRLLKRPRTV